MKYALLIGINYIGTDSELNGCINDILNMKQVLTTTYGFLEENCVMLIENDERYLPPTKENILNELNKIATNTAIRKLWVHYSGHGSYVADLNGDEKDKRDECICPLDYDTAGFIIDDDLSLIFKSYKNMDIIVIFDCCHSGTALDLPVLYDIITKKTQKQNNNTFPSNIIFISGCKDTQTSADAFINSSPQGAMTASLLTTLRFYNFRISLVSLVKNMRKYLVNNNFDQVPQLSVSDVKLATKVGNFGFL